jgi:hypothetical protein
MKPSLAALSFVAAVPALVWNGAVAEAAEPTTTECLAASEASVKAATDQRLRDERTQLLVCAAASCPSVIRMECLSHVFETNTRIPTIILAARDASGADVGAVKVTMDGDLLTDRLDGGALSVDPGEHTFTFETDGLPLVAMRFLIEQAQKDRRELITFGAAPRPTAPVAESGLGARRTLALAVAGAGVVGLAIGSAFGAVALSQKSDAETACPGATCPTSDGVNKWSSAATSGTVSTVALILGGVGVGAGAVLWFSAPRATARPGARAQFGLGPGGLQVRGLW